MHKLFPLILFSHVVFAQGLDPIQDLAKDYADEKAGEYLDDLIAKPMKNKLGGYAGDKMRDYLRDYVDDKVSDLIDAAEGRLKEYHLDIDIEDKEGSKALLENQIEQFLKENNTSQKGEEKFFAGTSHLDRRTNTDSNALIDSSSVRLPVPSLSASSGSIDYITGASQAANGAVMKKAMEEIVGGLSYAYIIGLECVSPLTTSAMKQVQTWANQLNAMSIHSDELASAFNPALLPKTDRADSYLCEHALASKKKIDLVEARHICTNQKSRSELIGKHGNKFQKLLAGNYNIASKVLNLTDFSPEKRNLCLTLTGTIVVKDENGEKTVEVYPPLYRQAIEYLLSGETKKGYGFQEDGINVHCDSFHFPPTLGERKKIENIMRKIQDKLKQPEADFSTEEIKFIESSHLPIGSLITLLTQYKGTGAKLALNRYGDLIAFERILQFSEELVEEILLKAKSMRAVQVCGYELESYIEQVEIVLKGIEKIKSDHQRKMIQEQQAVDSMIQIEKSMKEREKDL